MKPNFLYAVVAITLLTGCATGKYMVDKTFTERKEFGPDATVPVHSDVPLAQADRWMTEHMW